ncbi:hypothetical protein BVU17_09560 [Haloarcula taiwanensis]|uniref:Uncharacterized protein n=1 Tax=Haloarcula taiwanensis TaxID=1932004 RepID=A0A2H5A2C2_9EURY|nr:MULTISPECIES: hypothetical protein [Haloarcula]AUG48888.1 hypothetical protein BVU17_09560 [Haloarcula taiwanensis]RLM40331.1 hypothetical protein DVK01_00415 [Haloarcula sp. Atlit-120R]RLM48351.1 hypothetical protein DVK00_00415 [Haloarcula sp. Atlit-47R]RLM90671.1 hypothetical protein D3D01_17170 [Haloarcula sp. Atlit-7R]
MSSGIVRDADGTYNKRLLGLVLLVLLAAIGAGVGTLGLTDTNDPAPNQPAVETPPTPTESPSAETPAGTDSTPTESGGSGSPPPSALLTETPTPATDESNGTPTSNTTVA